MSKKELNVNVEATELLIYDLVSIIEKRKQIVYRETNSNLVLMFWEIGKRINEEILKNERAEYGKQIVVTLSRQLENKYGSNFETKNFRRMIQFAREFDDLEVVIKISKQLSWSHILALLPLKSMDARLYYAEEVSKYNLGVRDLRHFISRKA